MVNPDPVYGPSSLLARYKNDVTGQFQDSSSAITVKVNAKPLMTGDTTLYLGSRSNVSQVKQTWPHFERDSNEGAKLIDQEEDKQ